MVPKSAKDASDARLALELEREKMSDKQQFGLGIKTHIYNHELRSRRVKMGLSQRQLDAALNLSLDTTAKIETFKWYPDYEKLEDIAAYLGTTIDILFPEWLRDQRVKKSTFDQVVMVEKISLEAPEMNLLEAPDDVKDLAEQTLMHEQIKDMLDILTERQKKIIRMRFGLYPEEKVHTLEEVAKEFNVTRERIREIEAKALAQLRKHPDARLLHSYLGGAMSKKEIELEKKIMYDKRNKESIEKEKLLRKRKAAINRYKNKTIIGYRTGYVRP